MSISEKTRVNLQIGQIIVIIGAIVSGASWMTGIESKSEQAIQNAESLEVDIKDMKKELARQRELIATIQGDTRAILQLTKLRNNE